MSLRFAALILASTAGCFGASSAVADAAPYCYETGPGYQKCVGGGGSNDYFNPIYEGPKVFDSGNVPWAPAYSPPAAPVMPPVASTNAVDLLAGQVLNNIQSTLDADPGQPQFNVRVLHVSLVQTGNTAYEGAATMTAGGGPPHDIPVHVFNADGTLTWKVDPGVMAVLIP